MKRVCFELRVKPDRLAEYTDEHARVWPEMLVALKSSGWHNYSLFMRPDGLVIGYFETEDLAAAQSGIKNSDANAVWQEHMADFLLDPGPSLSELTEVFHLEDQLFAGGDA